MLVLSRGRGERIVIQTPQGDVTLTILAVRHEAVKIGFEAPRDIRIHRDEVCYPRPDVTD